MLKSIIEALYAEQPETLLYHYTSLSGLLGIVQSRTFRASEVRYMNDGQELRQFVQRLDTEIQKRLKEGSGRADVLSQLQAWAQERVASGPLLFTISSTQHGNLLSQWRGYSPHGRGVSLGFSADRLLTMAKAGGFVVGKCVYDLNHQRKLAAQVIDAALETAEAMGPDPHAHPASSYHRAFLTIEADIIKISALVKNHSFSEECEWRLVSRVYENYLEAPIEYREGISTLIPYIDLPLLDRLPLFDHVFLGPTANPSLSMESLTKFLSKTGAAHHVTNSMTPLRVT